MKNSNSNSNAFFDIGKETLDESLVIPLDGYEDSEEERGKKRFYGFKLGSLNLLIDPNVRSEVFNDLEVTSVPLMPDHLLGLCSVRGALVPVYDLYQRLDIKAENDDSDRKRILILDDDENMVGVRVADMMISLQFDEQDVQQNVPTEVESINQFITYSYMQDNQKWFGFDHIKLFSSQ